MLARGETNAMASPFEGQRYKESDLNISINSADSSGPIMGQQPPREVGGGYQHVVGYPDPLPYQYRYAQPPLSAFYVPPFRFPERRPSKLFRGTVSAVIILFTVLCLLTLIFWVLLRPRAPDFAVTEFSVTRFNTSGPVLSAQWRASITVKNPNAKLNLYLDRIESFLYYEENLGESLLANGVLEPFSLTKKRRAEFDMELKAGEPDQPMVGGWALEAMRRERHVNGKVSFSLRFLVLAVFKSEGLWSRKKPMKVICDDLKVGIALKATTGNALLPKPRSCSVSG